MNEFKTIKAETNKLNDVFGLLDLFLKATSTETVFRIYSAKGQAYVQALTSHVFEAYIGTTESDIDITLLFAPFKLPPKETANLVVVPDGISINSATMTAVISKANTVLRGFDGLAKEKKLHPVTNQKQLLNAISTLDRMTDLKNTFRSSATIEVDRDRCSSRYPVAWVEIETGELGFQHTFDMSLVRFLRTMFTPDGLEYSAEETAIYFKQGNNILMCGRRYPAEVSMQGLTVESSLIGNIKADDVVEALKLFDKEARVTVVFKPDGEAVISSVVQSVSLTKTLKYVAKRDTLSKYDGPTNFLLNIFYPFKGEVEIYQCHNRAKPLLQVVSTKVKCLISSTD